METKRRRSDSQKYLGALTSYLYRHPYQRPHSALEEIEKRSRAMLAKSAATRFIDKGEDSKEVARLIEELRDVLSHYQVSGNLDILSSSADIRGKISQQQAIYNQITDLTVSILRIVSACRSDNQFFCQVIFRRALETPRGNRTPRARHGTG